MILLQASICWSAGVVSVVQSGPSWLRCCADEGAGHSTVASIESIRMNRRMRCRPNRDEMLAVLLPAAGTGFKLGADSGRHLAGWAEGDSTGLSDLAAHRACQPLPMKNDQILAQITEFCRHADMAESTFGRRAVND